MTSSFTSPHPVWPLTDRGLGQRLIDLALLPFIAGHQPFARQATFADVDSLDELSPGGGALEWELDQEGGEHHRLFRGERWRVHLLLVRRRPEVQVLVTADSPELADEVLGGVRRLMPAPPQADGLARLTLWSAGSGGAPSKYRRWLDAPRWDAIARNYAPDVRHAIERVMTLPAPPSQGGRLLLWYGEPGTGKTTAIRALAREWLTWADVHFVLDPEEFFAGPDYLMHVVTAEDQWWEAAPTRQPRWKLLVVEDADDLIRADARQAAGAALGRLLNLTDGVLGHGLRVLLLITTNEAIRGLHPAVVRPGRCLADVQFSLFTRRQAADWLEGQAEAPARDVSLAELYRIRGDLDPIESARRTAPAATYL